MEVPRRLFLTETGDICEDGDPRARVLLSGKGGVIAEAEAQRVKLREYLDQATATSESAPPSLPDEVTVAPEAKMVAQTTVEDKSVAGPDEIKAPELPPPPDPADDPGQTPEPRRIGGGRRGT